MMMVSKHHASSVGFPDSGGVGWGVGGMMTTLVHRHPEQYLHKSRFTRYLQYFRTEGSAGDSAPDSKLSGPKELRVFLISYDDYADDDHDGNDEDDDDDDGYIQINGYTDKLSIYLSINKPTSLYPMYHRKKTPKSYPRHSCCCLAKSAVIVDENSSSQPQKRGVKYDTRA